MKTAIYGGSFNPPHLGHADAAMAVYEELSPDRFFIIPDNVPPHKKLAEGSPDGESRLELCRLNFAGSAAKSLGFVLYLGCISGRDLWRRIRYCCVGIGRYGWLWYPAVCVRWIHCSCLGNSWPEQVPAGISGGYRVGRRGHQFYVHRRNHPYPILLR